MSAMRETMWRQPDDLGRVLGDSGPAERAAERIAGRRVLLSGTGTSWHAANHGACAAAPRRASRRGRCRR